jgi:hypothetical protein
MLDEICKARSPARAVRDPVLGADRVVPATTSTGLGGDIVPQPEGLLRFLHDRSVSYIIKSIFHTRHLYQTLFRCRMSEYGLKFASPVDHDLKHP